MKGLTQYINESLVVNEGKNYDLEMFKRDINPILKKYGEEGNMNVSDTSGGSNKSFVFEPNGKGFKDSKYDGMVISYDNGSFDVEERQAGEDESNIYVYGKYKSLEEAVKQFMKGNYVDGGTNPKEVWEMNDSSSKGTISWKDFVKKHNI